MEDEQSNKQLKAQVLDTSIHLRNQIVEDSPKGRFARFNEKLGCGACKSVYRAIDKETGREVA